MLKSVSDSVLGESASTGQNVHTELALRPIARITANPASLLRTLEPQFRCLLATPWYVRCLAAAVGCDAPIKHLHLTSHEGRSAVDFSKRTGCHTFGVAPGITSAAELTRDALMLSGPCAATPRLLRLSGVMGSILQANSVGTRECVDFLHDVTTGAWVSGVAQRSFAPAVLTSFKLQSAEKSVTRAASPAGQTISSLFDARDALCFAAGGDPLRQLVLASADELKVVGAEKTCDSLRAFREARERLWGMQVLFADVPGGLFRWIEPSGIEEEVRTAVQLAGHTLVRLFGSGERHLFVEPEEARKVIAAYAGVVNAARHPISPHLTTFARGSVVPSGFPELDHLAVDLLGINRDQSADPSRGSELSGKGATISTKTSGVVSRAVSNPYADELVSKALTETLNRAPKPAVPVTEPELSPPPSTKKTWLAGHARLVRRIQNVEGSRGEWDIASNGVTICISRFDEGPWLLRAWDMEIEAPNSELARQLFPFASEFNSGDGMVLEPDGKAGGFYLFKFVDGRLAPVRLRMSASSEEDIDFILV